jgi:hypothetical protein
VGAKGEQPHVVIGDEPVSQIHPDGHWRHSDREASETCSS